MKSKYSKGETMINVLILGVGGNVSQGILKALRKSDLKIHIIGACVSQYSSGLYMCDEALISPYACDNSFVQWVIDTSNKFNVDFIFTGVEENILVLSRHIQAIKDNTRAIFISSDFDKILIGQNKFETCKWLKDNGCNYPCFCKLDQRDSCLELSKTCGFPLLAKPCHGKSSKGIIIVNNQDDLNRIIGLNDYVLEEYLPDENGEYTVGCYYDKKNKHVHLIAMERVLRNGTTVYAKVIKDDEIEKEATRICERFKPRGPLNIQMRKNRFGKPVAFELNVRFSGSTAMRCHFGFKDVEAMIKEYLYDEDISQCFNIKEGEAFRFDSELYIYDNQVSLINEEEHIVNNFKVDFDNSLYIGEKK